MKTVCEIKMIETQSDVIWNFFIEKNKSKMKKY